MKLITYPFRITGVQESISKADLQFYDEQKSFRKYDKISKLAEHPVKNK